MDDFEEAMNRLTDLYEAVRIYLSWYDTAAESHDEPCDRELDYWLSEMRRLTDD